MAPNAAPHRRQSIQGPQRVIANVNIGTIRVGQTVTFALCGQFAPGASVVVTVNGTAVTTKTPVNGSVSVVVTAISPTVVQVDDPINAPAVCGTNTVVATGARSTGGTGSVSGTFTLQCTTATTSTTPLVFTGANVTAVALVGLVLIGLGAALVVLQRRRRTIA